MSNHPAVPCRMGTYTGPTSPNRHLYHALSPPYRPYEPYHFKDQPGHINMQLTSPVSLFGSISYVSSLLATAVPNLLESCLFLLPQTVCLSVIPVHSSQGNFLSLNAPQHPRPLPVPLFLPTIPPTASPSARPRRTAAWGWPCYSAECRSAFQRAPGPGGCAPW
jgi:hypothetical protein